MSLLFPRFVVPASRCGPARHEVAPLFSLFDDTLAELHRASRTTRKPFNPRFDVKETAEGYTLEGELPGIDSKDVNIEFTDDYTLRIKGRSERHSESGTRPQNAVEQPTDAVEDTPASETQSEKSHQATVEDEEQPANASVESTANQAASESTPTPEAKEPTKPSSQYWISERHTGEFTRNFSFPVRVDQEAVKASLRNGILSILVPKAPVPESRRINIE